MSTINCPNIFWKVMQGITLITNYNVLINIWLKDCIMEQ